MGSRRSGRSSVTLRKAAEESKTLFRFSSVEVNANSNVRLSTHRFTLATGISLDTLNTRISLKQNKNTTY